MTTPMRDEDRDEQEKWLDTHCQFCGAFHEFGEFGCGCAEEATRQYQGEAE